MAKNQNSEDVKSPQDEAVLEQPKEGNREAAQRPGAAEAKPPARLNLTRFLQEKQKPSGIRALLNAKYRTDVKTLTEWETALDDLLHKKTK